MSWFSVFGATFEKIDAIAFYPTDHSEDVGGGVLKDVHIGSNTNNTVHFPFSVKSVPFFDWRFLC